jgi:hypothetical protein
MEAKIMNRRIRFPRPWRKAKSRKKWRRRLMRWLDAVTVRLPPDQYVSWARSKNTVEHEWLLDHDDRD